jgi:RHS repeat-associated protein
MAKSNPFRFSTKYQDDETDLLYYGYRYLNPSSGRWVSRDPVGEAAGPNVFAFCKNLPPSRCDILGLAGYVYDEWPWPVGVWTVEIKQIELNNGSESIAGFYSKYRLLRDRPCPCKQEDIILVQAVYDPHYRRMMDASRNQNLENWNTPGPVPIPSYWNADTSWAMQDPLTIIDYPHFSDNWAAAGNWDMEDCAVCRTKQADGSVWDTVLGCVKFRFHRKDRYNADIIGQIGNHHGSPLQAFFAASEKPGKLWHDAYENWVAKTH